MDEYQHPLFFEAKELTDREKEKIRRHFQKRRDSGGGECGMIEKVGSNTYKICFKEKEDQERVLQRKFHTISLPCGELCLTVSRTDSPQNPDQSTSQSQTFTKANTKELEKIFPMDIFLMYYLRDNAKAAKVLQKQLSAISCTMELNLEAEEAVVRGDIEKGSFVSAAENWEIQVDRVFNSFTESYFCYHVVEPKKVKILLQDLSFVTDDIKVYTEGGYAVVVGEDKAVRERMATLETSLPTRKELPITEKHFRLVEEEFSQEMYAHCPEVQVRRGNATIILDGPDKDVQSGAAKLDELIKKIKEKRVKLCTALLTFITSSGAISKYQARFQQSLRSPVSLEVGSDLVLSSLSSDALDEAEAALQRDLSLANVQLQGAAAAPQDLDTVEKIMIKAQNEANCHELRVNFRLMPGPSGTASTMVQLVGYSENVNKLKEVLHDYQMNQVRTQEILNLPHPELVDCFDKVLNMIGVKQTKVTLKASHVPYPCVLMSGPRRLVQEVQADLNATVAGLISDTLVLDGPGAQLYFQAEGKVSKELVESSCQVLIREQQSVHSQSQSISIPSISRLSISRLSIGSPCFSGPGASSATPRCFITSRHCNTVGSIAINRTSLEIKLGSLEDEQVNVLVVPMLNRQLKSTKIGKGLLNKAGNAIKTKFDTMAANRTLVPGDILQVDAPRSLGCLKLFFIECSPWDGVRGWSVQALGIGLKRCLDLCVQQGFCSVAFPVIGPGVVLKFPLTEAIQVLTENIRHFGLSASCGSLSTIHIVIKPGYPYSEECYHDVYKHLSSTMNQGGQVSLPPLPLVQQQQPPSSVSADLSMLHTPSTKQQSVFLFLGLSRQDVDDAKRKLKDLYQAQCSTQTFTKGELAGLTQDDMKTLKQLVETQGLYLQRDQSGQGILTVSGLKDGVNQVMQMINACLHGSLRREVRVREEEDLYARVAWCIMGLNGNWERLPKKANHNLENKDTVGGIVDAQSIQWSVDLQQSVAVRSGIGQTAKLKRLVNLPDFSFPLYWDNMAAGQNLEVFELQPSSAEYRTVKKAFKQTVTQTVIKIERVQNVHLRRAYEVQKKHISDKNRHEGGAGEKFLYHGTTQDNCDSIMKTGFNRRFAGQNATSYGRGTYFAVHASYSAYPTYSKPAADGSQLMFVARVLTGIYTQGRNDMKVPPPRSASQPHDRYDSVVNVLNNPSMYVVFHDDQAYPDYLITFK